MVAIPTINWVRLNAFGFSRGAAAARWFIHAALNGDFRRPRPLRQRRPLIARVRALGIEIQRVEVKFVGLFDTVSAFGVNHENDTEQLQLEAITRAEDSCATGGGGRIPEEL